MEEARGVTTGPVTLLGKSLLEMGRLRSTDLDIIIFKKI